MDKYIFYLLIVIISLDFILERVLDHLNSSHRSDVLPDEIKDVYNEEQYKKQQDYKKANDRLAMVTSVFNYLIIMFMILFGGFGFIDDIIRKHTDNSFAVTLVFFGTIGLASAIINLPFSIYDTYVVEERFGFNRTSVKIFITDKIKGLLLAVIIGGTLLSVFLWFYLRVGASFWLYAWIMAALFSVFITFFYSTLIVPVFNRQTPLQEGELKDAINAMGIKTGFALDNVFVIDGSRRSTKANAYFTGFGRKKRIVLYDNLTNDLSTGEITAVLAHEIGHYKKKHVITGLITGILNTGLILFILSLFIDNPLLSRALGSANPSFHMGLLSFGILYSPVSLVTGLFLNRISRKHEYEADAFVKDTGLDNELINALKKLSSKNLSNLTPHPAYAFFYYSHPTLLQRIKALKSGNDQ